MTPCHYLLMMIETSTVWTPTSPHDCGQEKKQRCCEMEPSSCWGNWDRKWGSVWGHDIQTKQSEDFVFPTILYSPTRVFSHTHTLTHKCIHIQNHHASRYFIPLEVRVWYQPICSIHSCNPNSHTSTTLGPRSSFLFQPDVCHGRVTAIPKNTAVSTWLALWKRVREKG